MQLCRHNQFAPLTVANSVPKLKCVFLHGPTSSVNDLKLENYLLETTVFFRVFSDTSGDILFIKSSNSLFAFCAMINWKSCLSTELLWKYWVISCYFSFRHCILCCVHFVWDNMYYKFRVDDPLCLPSFNFVLFSVNKHFFQSIKLPVFRQDSAWLMGKFTLVSWI